MRPPAVSFRHLLRLSDEVGLLEHAEGIVPRRDLGYCVDDVARGLVAVCQAPDPAPELATLARRYLNFLSNAQADDGRFRNRLGYDRRWEDEPGVDDCWGRAVWGLGVAAARGPTPGVRTEALRRFELGVRARSPWPHAMAFAALGAASVLEALPDHAGSIALLTDAARCIGEPPTSETWPWPLPRLTYANAALAEATIAAGVAVGDKTVLENGLRMLRWLLELQTRDGHLSVIPAAGYEIGDSLPAFDQQPIEVAAIADACHRAALVTGQTRWLSGLQLCVAWFFGVNDANIPMFDETTGGGCDGLSANGRNRNQGAESTIAAICTLRHGRGLGFSGPAEGMR